MLADATAHAVGVGLALVGIAALSFEAKTLSGLYAASIWIYCIALITVFGVSAAYNLWPMCSTKLVLRRLDHSAIYFFIAGTYSPFLMGAGQGISSTVLFAVIWALALIGVTLKLAAPGHLDRTSILLYVGMGWSGLLAYDSVLSGLSSLSLTFVIAGGILYSAGVIFHMWDQLRFHNAIWHAFVVAAAIFSTARFSILYSLALYDSEDSGLAPSPGLLGGCLQRSQRRLDTFSAFERKGGLLEAVQ